MTPDEFGAKIKAKYPDYAGMDNTELSRRIIEKHPEYASQVDMRDAVAQSPIPEQQPRQSADIGEALLTNLPTHGVGQDIIRGLPAATGGMAGAAAGAALGMPLGPLGMALGGIGGAFLGGSSGEAARQGVAQGTAMAFPEAQYPVQRPGQVLRDIGIQGAANAAAEGLGIGASALGSLARPGINRAGAGFMKVLGGIPEKEGLQLMEKPSLLLDVPTRETVNKLYDAFHSASGTVSRKQFISDSAHPFDAGSVSHAVSQMEDALLALKNGTLTRQQAVNASQAGRIISDAKGQGQELAMQMSDTASSTKDLMDNWLDATFAGSRVSKQVPLTLPNAERTVAGHAHGMPRVVQTPVIDQFGNPIMMTETTVIPGHPGYPEWQAARAASRQEHLSEIMSHLLPRNKGNSTNVLRPWHGTTAGGVAGGAMIGGPVGAAIGGAVGFGLTSPLTYKMGLRAAAIAGEVAPRIYRVGAPVAASAAGSDIQQAYMAQPR